jgi:hypothetical protein
MGHNRLAATAGLVAAGVGDQSSRALLDELREVDEIDWSRAAVDRASV